MGRRRTAEHAMIVAELCYELDRAYDIIEGMKKRIAELEAPKPALEPEKP